MDKKPFPVIPNEDRIIIRPEKIADKTESGLWIPDTAKGKPQKGVVLAVGEGIACRHCGLPKEPHVKVGQTVTFPETAGIEYRIGDEDVILIRATDIQLIR